MLLPVFIQDGQSSSCHTLRSLTCGSTCHIPGTCLSRHARPCEGNRLHSFIFRNFKLALDVLIDETNDDIDSLDLGHNMLTCITIQKHTIIKNVSTHSLCRAPLGMFGPISFQHCGTTCKDLLEFRRILQLKWKSEQKGSNLNEVI